MELEYETPSTLDELIADLREIEHYFIYRQDVYEEPSLTLLTQDTLTAPSYTTTQLRTLATKMLAAQHVKDVEDREAMASEKVAECDANLYALNSRLSAEIAVITAAYNAEDEKLVAECTAKGLASTAYLTEERARRSAKKTAEIAAVTTKYDGETSKWNNLRSYYADVRDLASSFFSTRHEKEILAKMEEIDKETRERADEVLKYNNQTAEKITKANNAILVSEAKLKNDYMKIVTEGLTDEQLAAKGYFAVVVPLTLNYFYQKANVAAYNEFIGEPLFITFLRGMHENVLRVLYTRAYGFPTGSLPS